MVFEAGIEKVDNLWCIFKKEDERIYWLDINKKFVLYKGSRAGVNCMNKATKLIVKVFKNEI